MNLTKEVKIWYSENCKMMMKITKDFPNRWKDKPCSWIRRINIIKKTILLKEIYRFNAILTKYQWHFSQN